jgi:hypothetical protein
VTLLPNGRVLVAGGFSDSGIAMNHAALYDPVTEGWTTTGMMRHPRALHTATLLPNGKVLVAGGSADSTSLSSAELYDPAAGTWTLVGSLSVARSRHTATLLCSGKVLVAGGSPGGSSAELYDPATGLWTPTGPLAGGFWTHTATLLLNGQVLIVAGDSAWRAVELYDPVTGTWTVTASLTTGRQYHTATLLPNGQVLVAGGRDTNYFPLASAEVYDPVRGTWSEAPALLTSRCFHSATMLPNGKVLVAGGWGGGYTYLASAELFDVGLGFSASWQPQIATVTSPLDLGGSLEVTGSGFRGLGGGSGGNMQDSPTDYPLVQLQSLESGQTTFLLSTNWQTNSFSSVQVWNFPPGYAMATLFVNGIPSTGAVLNISVPVPTAHTLTAAKMLANSAFQFSFTNTVGALFGVLATTNPALPLGNWTPLGGVTEVSPGQFEFTDPEATSTPCRFYRLRSP